MVYSGILIGLLGVLITAWAGWANWKSLWLTQGRGHKRWNIHSIPITAQTILSNTYLKIANSMKILMTDSGGDFPGSMTKNLARKVLLAEECTNILKDYSAQHDRVYFAMSTTCHIIFEIAVKKQIVSDYLLEIHTSSIPLLLSAQINRINCNVFGRHLVHEYASLTFEDGDEIESIHFDCVFLCSRSDIAGKQEVIVWSCKQ